MAALVLVYFCVVYICIYYSEWADVIFNIGKHEENLRPGKNRMLLECMAGGKWRARTSDPTKGISASLCLSQTYSGWNLVAKARVAGPCFPGEPWPCVRLSGWLWSKELGGADPVLWLYLVYSCAFCIYVSVSSTCSSKVMGLFSIPVISFSSTFLPRHGL